MLHELIRKRRLLVRQLVVPRVGRIVVIAEAAEDLENVLWREGLPSLRVRRRVGGSQYDVPNRGLLVVPFQCHCRLSHATLLLGREEGFRAALLCIVGLLPGVPVRIVIKVMAQLGDGCVARVLIARAAVRPDLVDHGGDCTIADRYALCLRDAQCAKDFCLAPR